MYIRRHLYVAIAPSTDKIIKTNLDVLERGQNLLKNGILNFAFRLSQSSVIALQSLERTLVKTDCL